MRRTVVIAIALLGLWTWHVELFHVSPRGAIPRPLATVADSARRAVAVDVVLPQVPGGMRRLQSGAGVLLVHYWAPWEHDGAAQATALDSLRHEPGMEEIQIVIVCFDPFPSVARYVGKHQLRLPVLLDHGHQLTQPLPCPSLPYTYVIDRGGSIAVAQGGEVDWLSAATRRALRAVVAGTPRPAEPPS